MAYDLEPIRHLYPFDSHHLDIDGHRLHYLDEGTGPAVVMLHGNPTWSFYYRDLVRNLCDRHRVIVPDHIGCGLSDKPQDYPYRLETHIRNLTRLLEHLQLDDLSLVMHDWGGAIGCGWAIDHADQINRIVLFNTAAFAGPCPFRIRICKWPVIGPILVRRLNAFAAGAVRTACLNRATMTPDVKAGYLLPYNTHANRVAVLRFVQDIPLHPDHPTGACIQRIDRHLHHLLSKPM
ncbi:MAG: alpha/beta fold hydrolase, partial [Phycisphaerae bacterium]